MLRRARRYSLLVLALAGLSAVSVAAPVRAASPDLFYNFYSGPAYRSYYPGVPAEMYLSPRPTPPLVGHTWITYQPLMPHEFLYRHHRTYYRYYPHGGHTTTRVHWR
jgi:hypothetical protein